MSHPIAAVRPNGRPDDALRPLSIALGAMKFAEGSSQIDLGDTRLLISASFEKRVPGFLENTGQGWVTAEYSMLPRATQTRNGREAAKGRQSGRTLEIQRLIGRSLRAAVDTRKLGERTVTLDCDVVQADGGTRTAAVTGAYCALVDALAKAYFAGDVAEWPIVRQVAAVSVGFVDGRPLLDLEYVEDSRAEVDFNVVATSDLEIIELQGTGEKRSYSRRELDQLLDVAFAGVRELVAAQDRVLAPILAEVEALRSRGRRRVKPRDEGSLWGPPTR
jgi:ribonuclease PH